MLKKAIISILIVLVCFNNLAFATDFSSSAQIDNTGNKKYKTLRLTPQIYNNTKDNLADILIYNENNETLPYFVNSYVENSSETKNSYAMKLINSFTVAADSKGNNSNDAKYKHYFMDYTLSNPQKNDIMATSIEVNTDATDFAKKVELLGSYDGNTWDNVQNDVLYNVDNNKKLEIFFSGIKKYTYYRFKVLNNLEKVSFSSVKLNYNNIIKKKDSFSVAINPQYSIETRGESTGVKINGLKNVKVDSIAIETDSMFKRSVSFEDVKSKMLYNLSFKDTEYKDTTLELNSYKVKKEQAELIIQNGDDKPININKIEVKYLADELIFDGSKGKYFTIKFNNSDISKPPSYDIVNYKDKIISEGYDVLEIKDIKSEQAKSQTPKYDYKLIFNIVISLIAVIMGVLIFLKLKKT